MQAIHLDISKELEPAKLLAKQADVGRKFLVVITDNGEPYSIPVGASLSLWYSGTSGEGNYTKIGDKSAFSISGNTITVEMIAQMLLKKGGGKLCLVMNAVDGTQLGMWDIPYITEGIPGAESEEAKQYFTAFSDMVSNAATDVTLSIPGKAADAAAVGKALENAGSKLELDATLSVSGMAADAAAVGAALKNTGGGGTVEVDTTLTAAGKAAEAKAVGTALSGKAPAGFGLGTATPVWVDSPDDALLTGLYYTSDLEALDALLLVFSESPTTKRQDMFNYTNGNAIHWTRWMIDSVWQPWEWVNPPMVENISYRTTERHNSKPVYVRLINYGPVSSVHYGRGIMDDDYGNFEIVEAYAYFSNGWDYSPYYHPNDLESGGLITDAGSHIQMNFDFDTYRDSCFADYNLYLKIKYVLI